jgi:hypothetical protein
LGVATALRELGLVEGRRLVVHPAFAGSFALSIVWFVTVPEGDPDFLRYKNLLGAGLLPLAAGVAVASNLGASRARRDRAEELYTSLPVTGRARASAHVLSLAFATAGAVGLVFAAVVALRAWDGLRAPELADAGGQIRSVTPGMFELAQGPVFVCLAGLVGVALAVWVPSAIAASLAVLVGAYVQGPAVLWWTWEWQRWLLPLAHNLETSGWVPVGEGGVLSVHGIDQAALGWHLVYLVGLAVLSGTAVLGRFGRDRRLGAALAGGAVLAGMGGTLQVVVSSG